MFVVFRLAKVAMCNHREVRVLEIVSQQAGDTLGKTCDSSAILMLAGENCGRFSENHGY